MTANQSANPPTTPASKPPCSIPSIPSLNGSVARKPTLIAPSDKPAIYLVEYDMGTPSLFLKSTKVIKIKIQLIYHNNKLKYEFAHKGTVWNLSKRYL